MTDFEAIRDARRGDNSYSFDYWAQLTDRQRGAVKRVWSKKPGEEFTYREATELRYHRQLFESLHNRDKEKVEEIWDRMDTMTAEQEREEERDRGDYYWDLYD